MSQVPADVLRAIFDCSPDAILLADDRGQLTAANGAALDLTGYTRDELLRLRVFDLTLEELRHDTDALWSMFREAGYHSGPFELQRKDGSRRVLHYRATASILPGVHLSVLRDVTHEHDAFKDLQRSEQFLDAVFEHSPISLQVFDAHGRILRANRAWERLWGTSRAALAGYNVLEDPQLNASGSMEQVRAAFRGTAAVLPAMRYDPAASGHPGRIRWLNATFVPVTAADGSVRQVVLALEDQTERRASDRRAGIQYAVSRVLAESAGIDDAGPRLLRVIGETMEWGCGVLWLMEDGRRSLRCHSLWTAEVAGLDAFASRMRRTFEPGTGLPGSVCVTREPRCLVDLADAPDFPTLAAARASGLRSAIAVPVMVNAHTLGAMEFFSLDEQPLEPALVETLRGIGHQVGQYIERRAAEQSEAVAARNANHLKDEFLAVLSHELRTPLNAILGWTRLLRSGQIDEATRSRAFEIIERNTQAQSQIVEDLLDVSRIITGKLRIDMREVDVTPIMRDMVESMRPGAEAKGVTMAIDLNGPARVLGDPNRLQQIAWNLLTNALKFTPRGGRVTLSVRRESDAVALVVSDTGAGIDPALLPRVFDRFLQADSSTTRQHGGLGLGLAIVRHLAELHGGNVTAESEGPGRGATFRVTLPLLNAS